MDALCDYWADQDWDVIPTIKTGGIIMKIMKMESKHGLGNELVDDTEGVTILTTTLTDDEEDEIAERILKDFPDIRSSNAYTRWKKSIDELFYDEDGDEVWCSYHMRVASNKGPAGDPMDTTHKFTSNLDEEHRCYFLAAWDKKNELN